MADLTHSICDECYMDRQSSYPVRLKREVRHWELCCWCRTPTFSGIYFRADLDTVLCGGHHYEGGFGG